MSQPELLIVKNKIKKKTEIKKNRITNVSEKIKTNVGTYAPIHGTKDALERFNIIYPKDTFLRTSINNWKSKIKKDKVERTIFKQKGQPSLLSDDLMAKVKTIMIGARAAGTLSRSTVMIIGNGMVRSNNPILEDRCK